MNQQAPPKLSIWEKSEERSIAKKYLHGNFKTEHITPNEHYLGRAGLRGRKRWFCLAIFLLIYLFALAHLTLTCTILGVLRFNFNGSPYLIFQEDGSLTWPQGASLSTVRLSSQSSIRSYADQILTLSGQHGNEVTLQATQSSTIRQLSLDSRTVKFSSDSLNVYSSREKSSEHLQLSVSESAVEMNNLLTANHLQTTRVNTNSVRNASQVRADNQLLVMGAMRVTMEGKQIAVSANGNITISSRVITISGERVTLPRVQVLSGALNPASQYHLCVCANGQVLLVESSDERCSVATETCS